MVIPAKKQTVILMPIFLTMFLSPASPAFAQNVFPITIGGQEKIYMDSNNVEGIDDGDRYFTLKRVTLEDAGDDTDKDAIIVDLQGKDYKSIYVLDGLDENGELELHEPQIDVAYRDNNGDKVTVKNKWAHIGEEGAPTDYEGFIHSVKFGMSNPNTPYHGFNKMDWQIERGTSHGENPAQAGVTVEYNNDNYADTLSYDTGGPVGTLLMDIAEPTTEITHNQDVLKQVFGSYGSKTEPVHIPVDNDGNVLLTDNESDGFFMKFALKPVRDDNGTPTRLPPKREVTPGMSPAINMFLLQTVTEPSGN